MAALRIPRMGTTSIQGRNPTSGEAKERSRHGRQAPGRGHPDPVWAEARNGVPLARPYVWQDRDAPREAGIQAYLAAVRAKLRGGGR